MNNTKQSDQRRHWPVGLAGGGSAALVGVAMVLFALVPAMAKASFEQLPAPNGVFSGSADQLTEAEIKADEEIQLGTVTSMAVNRTGAGGVPKGTVYAITRQGEEIAGNLAVTGTHVAMYEPTAGGGLRFVEGWLVTKFENPSNSFVCGPEAQTLPDGSKPGEHSACRPDVSGNARPVGVGVDQATGSIYVYGGFETGAKVPFSQVVVYSADGGSVVTRIGEAAEGPSIAESPEKTHDGSPGNNIAVNTTGEVYVYDAQALKGFYQRLMVYRPHNGDLKDYEYAGEVAASAGPDPEQQYKPLSPVFDDAGHLFVAGLNEEGGQVEELARETPTPYPELRKPPVCRYEFSRGGLNAMTVDPASGEPFFYSEKGEKGVRYVRRLGVCNEASGRFALPDAGEPEPIAFSPQRGDIYALAFDPGREVGESRPSGVLYAGVPEPNHVTAPSSSLGFIFGHPRELAPKVEKEAAYDVGVSSAAVQASVNPNGFGTSYVFQFVTEAEYQAAGETFAGAIEAPAGGGSIQSAGGTQSVTAALGDLAPDTTYRVRLLADSSCKGEGESPCQTVGEEVVFHTYPAGVSLLLDGRMWELVSPANKEGGQVLPADPNVGSCSEKVIACKPGAKFVWHLAMFSAPDGDAVAYAGTSFGLGGAANSDEYVARRSTTGWQTVNTTPSMFGLGSYRGFGNRPGGGGVIEQEANGTALSPSAPAGFTELYQQVGDDPSALVPLTGTPPNRGQAEFVVHYAAASSDGSRIFFSANDALTEGSQFAPAAQDGGTSKFNLYEWHEGQLSLVNVNPGNTETEPGATFASAGANTVSADGSRVFFSNEAGRVYVRIDGKETRQIPDAGSFLSAATNGSRVLLANGLVYDLENETTTDLAEGRGGFQGIAGQSNDLSDVYFVDTKVLDTTPNQEGEVALEGEDNLYASSEGGHARFIARLAESDDRNGEGRGVRVVDWAAVPAQRTAEASMDGRYLAFMTTRPIKKGYDNTGLCEADHNGGLVDAPCQEAYLYDAQTGRLVCGSCTPSGTVPLGPSTLLRPDNGIDGTQSEPQPRYLTDSGRLFFDSQSSLSPLDTNEGAEDVYEYEPDEIGSCGRESGCVALISSGREASDSNFVATDDSGKNVFFTTHDRLASNDEDEMIDLYDAREGGGFQSESVLPQRPCVGEACQVGVTPSIFAAPPGTISFTDPGNIASQSTVTSKTITHKSAGKAKKAIKCPRGKTRKHGRCVKMKRRRQNGRSSQTRSSRNRGGAK